MSGNMPAVARWNQLRSTLTQTGSTTKRNRASSRRHQGPQINTDLEKERREVLVIYFSNEAD